MADEQYISKIELPNGEEYLLKDASTGISSTYDSTTRTVVLTAGHLDDADTTEY